MRLGVVDERYVARCPRCGRVYEAGPLLGLCPKCGVPLELVLDTGNPATLALWEARRGRGVWRYQAFLPQLRERVTMGEGSTPLIRLRGEVYAKFEGSNPTGSFKDRGMTVAVSIARLYGYRATLVASTGNTAASAAAYSARAGMRCQVLVPRGGVARGKLFQALLHGAEVVEVEDGFDAALSRVLRELSGRVYPLNSFNPWRLEGQKTLAFEVYEELGVPDVVVVPVGNAGNIYAIWKGFRELVEAGIADRVPRMVGVQAVGAAPLYETWRRGASELLAVDRPATRATAIRIGRPINWVKAIRAVRESGGAMIAVEDSEILAAQKELARMGIGAEPAGAASYAGYLRALEEGLVGRGEKAVVVVTGHALKDPDPGLVA